MFWKGLERFWKRGFGNALDMFRNGFGKVLQTFWISVGEVLEIWRKTVKFR